MSDNRAVTIAELEALPEMGMQFGVQEVVVDGRTERRAVLMSSVKALYQGPDEVMFTDSRGIMWRTGTADGVRYKVRFFNP